MSDIIWQETSVKRKDRESLLNQKGRLIWFTGLSGSGKTTIANALAEKLHSEGRLTYVLDGDNIRHGLSRGLGFSKEDRAENIRRIGEVAKLFVDAGIIVMAAFISPYRKDREAVRALLGDDFTEVYVKCSIEECKRRDTKGLYEKAEKGEIKEFTGISAPYEEPENPDVVVDTTADIVRESLSKIRKDADI